MQPIPPLPLELCNKIATNLKILSDTKINDFHKLDVIYKEADDILKFLHPFFSCNSGCSNCCYYDVLITEFEAKYISLKTNRELFLNNSLTINNRKKCIFLENNICTIYDYRPFVCRTYHAYGNPNHCKIDSGKEMIHYGSELSGYGNIIFKEMARFIFTVNNFKNGKRRDIRNFFKE